MSSLGDRLREEVTHEILYTIIGQNFASLAYDTRDIYPTRQSPSKPL